MAFENLPHFYKLRKDQRPVTCRNRFFQHFSKSRKFSGTSFDSASVSQELRGMIANLLELGKRCKNHPFSFYSFRLFYLFFHVMKDGCVKRCLFFGKVAKHFH